MSDYQRDVQAEWNELFENTNRAVAQAMERNMEASAAFMESWAEAMEDSVPEQEQFASGIEGYSRAYEVWMDAADQMFERTADGASGEEIELSEFRDIWLQSANEAFKEVMGTSAFAAANGQLVSAMMELREQTDEIGEETIAELGMPTRSNVEEVGKRLVELERRQHRVERKLDRILEAIE